ncbi:hypothetical protein ASPCADRAFT_8530 [Aspergillus carbonarius ITEM 5010]|uniref:Uncharacterized protein n=1 Tax=Aspergillus carbonarius (strain ITEM 5010) TaxID=602072 RepID=A0A1R3REK8_ASPC5|nr:hypothetical protein ASPCADRAFT_8530 [Aspergillus carbonarius ITEM 5010]
MVNLQFEVETWVQLKPRATQNLEDQWNTPEGFIQFLEYLNSPAGGTCDLKQYDQGDSTSRDTSSWHMCLDASQSRDKRCTVGIHSPILFVCEDSKWRETIRSFWEKLNNACRLNFAIVPTIEVKIKPMECDGVIPPFKTQAHAMMHFYKVIKEMAGLTLDRYYATPEMQQDLHDKLDDCKEEKDVCQFILDHCNGGLTWEMNGTTGKRSAEYLPAILVSPENLTYDAVSLWVEFFVWFTQASLSVPKTRLAKYQRNMAGLQYFVTDNVPEADLDLSQIAYVKPESRPVPRMTVHFTPN